MPCTADEAWLQQRVQVLQQAQLLLLCPNPGSEVQASAKHTAGSLHVTKQAFSSFLYGQVVLRGNPVL
jgi:hypothetical protein